MIRTGLSYRSHRRRRSRSCGIQSRPKCVVRLRPYSACMEAKKQVEAENGTQRKKVRKRQFVVRLDQPGTYDKLLDRSLERCREEGRRVPMTAVAREAIEAYLDE